MTTSGGKTDALPALLAEAVRQLRAGRPVVVATETVFGIACDASSDDAVAAVFALKGRDEGNPLPVLVADVSMARTVAAGWSDAAQSLADAFWPGPVTIVLEGGESLAHAVSAGTGRVGLRCPDHARALSLVRAFGAPLALTSANRSGEPPCTTAEAVQRFLHESGQADIVIVADSDACSGKPSTVVQVGSDEPSVVILREGAITRDEVLNSLQ